MTAPDSPTITSFGRQLREGSITAEQATEDCLRRIDAGAGLNAFILVMADGARQDARRADQELAAGRDRGPLHGVPISIKDLIDVAGTPTTAASRVREGHVAARDAPVVAALRNAGAVIIGKTNLHEFALGTTTEESAFGPARNPYDPTRSPGGSSGGSAISVATGMALASIGTDTGGSIRIPAAACGVVGLKPKHGDVTAEGVVPLSKRLDHVGPLARSVTDACLVYGALVAGTDARLPRPTSIAGLRLGIPSHYFCDLLDHDVRSRFEEAVDRLRRAGATVDDVEIPHAALISPIYQHIVLSDAAAYHGPTLERMPERYTPPVRIRLEMGRYLLAEDFIRALDGMAVLGRAVHDTLAQRHALVLPTLPIPAPTIGAPLVQLGAGEEPVRNVMLRLTQLFNLTGQPAIAIPAGLTSTGLPCSVQLVAAETDALLGIALACEPLIDSHAAGRL